MLGNRAGALRPAHTDQILVSCAQDGEIIDAGMMEELSVLGRQYGILQVGGNFFMSDDDAPLNRKLPDYLTVIGIDIRDDIRAIIFQSLDFW